HLRAGKNDVRELGDREQSLADIGVADVVGDDVDDERINRLECGALRAGFGHWRLPRYGVSILCVAAASQHALPWKSIGSRAEHDEVMIPGAHDGWSGGADRRIRAGR